MEEDMSPPFWMQNGDADRRRLHRSYSVFLSSGALLIFLLVTAFAFIFFIVPTLHSFTSHIFKPNSVKKSWDSLNLVLVLFAIFCGFLSRNNTNNNTETPRSYEDRSFSNTPQEYTKPNPETPRSWYDQYPDRTPYYRLRSFNSYPDLRQESSWVTGDERWRFYDDTRVNGYRGLDFDVKEKEEEQGIKNIEVDTFETRSSSVRRNTTKKKYQQETIEKSKSNNFEAESSQIREKKNKRTSATKELLTSLKGKKKKQRHKSVDNLQSMLNSEPHTRPSQPPPPPPPPPPPSSSSGFHTLFSSKKSKHKKLNPVSPSPPKHHVSSKTKQVVHRNMETMKPKEEDFNFYTEEENVITGNESPLIPIPPPPPPPPPFKMPAWKFRVQGDFVRIDSISSSSSGSPDIDEVLDSVSPTSVASQGNSPSHVGESEILLFYPSPSPDVDSKADNFIERFRAGLRMEKMNSTKEKQGIGRSNLRPSTKVENKKKMDQVKGAKLVNATMF